MAALLASIIVWGIVGFMFSDDYCREHERRVLKFLIFVGSVLTAIGLYNFDSVSFFNVSLHDWMLLGLLPIVLVNLRFRMYLVKIQSKLSENNYSIIELDLSKIQDKQLVRVFNIINIVMWIYVFMIIGIDILRA